MSSEAWVEVVFPILQEAVASVSGRFTNGRYWHGSLTTIFKDNNSLFVAGYQKGLMDFYNTLNDFIVTKDKLLLAKKKEAEDSKAPVYNPFMEELESDN